METCRNKNSAQLLLLILFFVLFPGISFSQVTIGLNEKPEDGAILQLKNITGVTTGIDNSTKGLGLPRVNLTASKPKIGELAESIGSSSTQGVWDEEEHIGLTVYSVYNGCDKSGGRLGPGVYVWDGEEWRILSGLGSSGSSGYSGLEKEDTTAKTVTDRDGNTYNYASFGSAGIWMTENLRTITMPGGTPLTEGYGEKSPGTAADYYENGFYLKPGGTWIPEYGLLYNWQAATNGDNCSQPDIAQNQFTDLDQPPGPNEVEVKSGKVQGICPTGWHIPSDREWNMLEKEIYENARTNTNYTIATWTPSASAQDASKYPNWPETYPAPYPHGRPYYGHTKLFTLPSEGGLSKPANAGGFAAYLSIGHGVPSSGGGSVVNTSKVYYWTSSFGTGGSVSAQNAILRQFDYNIARNQNATYTLQSVRCKKN